MRRVFLRLILVVAGVLESPLLFAAGQKASLPVAAASKVARFVLGSLAIIFGVAALVNYVRGDLYDGNSHWKKYILGCITCVVLFGIFSKVAGQGHI